MAGGSRLVDLVVEPMELLRSKGRLRINAQYYITKVRVGRGLQAGAWVSSPSDNLNDALPGVSPLSLPLFPSHCVSFLITIQPC